MKKAERKDAKTVSRNQGRRQGVAAFPKPYKPSGKKASEFREGQPVELEISGRTAMGYRAIIDNSHEGLLYGNEVFRPLRRGQRIAGFIKRVREDGKIDLSLQKPGVEKVDNVADKIVDALRARGGFLGVDDKSRPEVIYRLFGISKKTYKKAIGGLYKRRIIVIEADGIRLAAKKGE